MAKIPKQVSDYMSKLGQKGGSVSSEAKAEAARLNGRKGGRPAKAKKSTKRKPRQQSRRYCPKCEAEITSTDVEAGYCTNCKVKV